VFEFARKEMGYELLDKVKDILKDISQIDSEPSLSGRRITLVLSPK
jgi:translation initiation factor IF-3